ncbi:uncharacterized protein NECHADRAFT_78055 [Fusarium vanettenii 77-13-4]|uniref:DUF676 domain-containing protein n=1 Tax=Fusarium vanettenii (strain ATCC MYA-4622 / CBS 123669 / FGSC 9596 / NRRL 45880 / 77-13-4) TaxID=660122 RepID=C7YMZ9_FUSV7|nr:uncharacterized protein NECHADRAFT_78055 [Fusarium vanettenii 77-13-4]EEU47036.1 predicted protein [Fusarium vanettenii 77-13-4]
MSRQSHSDSDSLALSHNRYGITEFFEGFPNNCRADIVFVHGLTGNSDTTWRHENADLPWPEELLARDIRNCKILKYDYNISNINGLGKDLARLAADLLNELVNWRRDNKSERPIIFVAHSLGGLLVKRLLPESQSRSAPYNIGALTRGVIFLGTPQRVSRLQEHGHKILQALRGNRANRLEPNVELRAIFQPTSDVLDKTHSSFMDWLAQRNEDPLKPTVHIASLYEKLPTMKLPGLGDGYCTVRAQIVKAVRLAKLQDELALRDTAEPSKNELELWRACLQSFAFSDVRQRFETVSPHLRGTFRWIHYCHDFWAWLEDPSKNIFYMSGKRASGKSTFMKYLTRNEALASWARIQNPSREVIVLSHFFHYAGQDPSRKFEGFLRSILFQMVEKDFAAFKPVQPFFEGRRNYQQSPTWPRDDLEKACLEVFKEWGRRMDSQRPNIYLIMDALDHFDGELCEMTSFLLEIFKLSGRRLKICISSPHEEKIDNAFTNLKDMGDLSRLEIHQHTKQDIALYIKRNYRKLTELSVGEKTFADVILDHSQGVFLWVRLMCNNLVNRAMTKTELDKTSDEELQRMLNNLQPDLEKFYEMMFNAIEPDLRDEVEKGLSIVVAASRSLTVEELQCATYFSNHKNIMIINNDDNRSSNSTGTGNKPKSKISKEYLTRLGVFNQDLQTIIETRYRGFLQITKVQGGDAEPRLIIEPCHGTASTYLIKRCKPQGPGATFRDLVAYGDHLLYESSRAYLGYLEKGDLPPEASKALEFLFGAKNGKQSNPNETKGGENTSSYMGSMTVSLDKLKTVDIEKFCSEYPFLSYSAECWGHHAKVGCLTKMEPVQVLEGDAFQCFLWVFWELMEARPANPYTFSDLPLDALEYLCSTGCANYLDRALDKQPERIRHPERLLLFTIRAKNLYMVGRLLQHYPLKKLHVNHGEQAVLQAIDFSNNPDWGKHWAKHYAKLTKNLLDHRFPAHKRVEYTIRDEHWNTNPEIRVRKRQFECNPLLLAILLKRNYIAEELLTHESCEKAVHQEIDWVLQRVIEMTTFIQPANISGIELLLRNGANANTSGSNSPKSTLLGMALYLKEFDVAETLLNHGADPNFRGDHASQLSFMAETENDFPKGVQLLLRSGASVDVWSMEQCCKGRRGAKDVKDVVFFLMDHLCKNGGIDQLIQGRETALHIAIRCGREDLVERLIQDLEANTNIPDHNGDYPVHVALRQSEPKRHIKLLQRSPKFDGSVKNRDGKTFTDIHMEEDPQQNILVGMPRLDASKVHMRTVLLQAPLGYNAVQKRLENAPYGIRVLFNDPNAPWSALRPSVDNMVVDHGLHGNEIHLPTQPEAIPRESGDLPFLEGAITDEMEVSFPVQQMYAPSISDTSGGEFLAGTGSWDGHSVYWNRQ